MPTPPRLAARDQPAAAAPTRPGPTRQRRKETRPQELLDAALALFVEKGFAATHAEEVAQRAGVSKGTLYLYYPSKEELFKAVIRQNLSSSIAQGLEMVAGYEGSTADLLVQLAQVWWDRVGNTPAGGIIKIILAEVRNFPDLAQFYVDEVIVPANHLLGMAVHRGIKLGEFRDLPAQAVAHVLMAPIIFMALHRHSFGACPVQGNHLDPDMILKTHLDLALHGLCVPGKSPAISATATRQKAKQNAKQKATRP